MLSNGEALVIASGAPTPATAIAAEFRSPCALVRSFAGATAGVPTDETVNVLARSAVATLVEKLAAHGIPPPAKAQEAGRMAELAALAEALA